MINKVKDWLNGKKKQFVMIPFSNGTKTNSYFAIRINDSTSFKAGHTIYCNGRKGTILDFMSDYIHVMIELRKPQELIIPSEEFNPGNYDYIEVPINDLSIEK